MTDTWRVKRCIIIIIIIIMLRIANTLILNAVGLWALAGLEGYSLTGSTVFVVSDSGIGFRPHDLLDTHYMDMLLSLFALQHHQYAVHIT